MKNKHLKCVHMSVHVWVPTQICVHVYAHTHTIKNTYQTSAYKRRKQSNQYSIIKKCTCLCPILSTDSSAYPKGRIFPQSPQCAGSSERLSSKRQGKVGNIFSKCPRISKAYEQLRSPHPKVCETCPWRKTQRQ